MPKITMNQFSLEPLKGAVAALLNDVTVSCQVDPDSVATLYPGTGVVLTESDGATILVDKALITDRVIGFVPYTPKKSVFVAGDPLEICFSLSILWGEASGSVDRGDELSFVPTGDKLIVTSGNPVAGIALDNAADGDIFRFMVFNSLTIPTTISGGTINNTPIGGSTPSTGIFTDLTVTGIATFSGTIAGGSPFVFEGATADAFETTLAITDPTADHTVTIPDAGGTFSILDQTALVITPGATPSWTPGASKSLSTLTPGENETIAAVTTGAVKGKTYYIEVVTSGVTSYTLTFGANFVTTGTLATGTVTAKKFVMAFVFDGTSFVEASRTTAM